jgi:murein DD-endopeptidase MepM/ murein hydrolase activator NlpD
MSARGRHRRQRVHRISRISLVLTAGGAGIVLPLIAAGGAGAATQQVPQQTAPSFQQAVPSAEPAANIAADAASYTVVSGDTLIKIATAQGVDGGWQQLYEANRDVIGAEPDKIYPGQELSLTPADEDTSTETATGFTAPVDAAVGTAYGVAGSMWSSGYHTGVDFVVGEGTPVVAVTSGQVVSAGDGGAYGNEVVIQHADGYYSQYAHLSSISVSAGQQVGTGDQIGLSGSTGNVTGPHLHFEIRTGPDYGSDIDPLAYLRANGVTI